MLGAEIAGKRLGIFGMGRIGQAVARRARGFDMELHYHKQRRLPAEREQGASFVRRPRRCCRRATSSASTRRRPPETHHFLNAERIERLPDGAIVVNTARGPLVDDEALIAALDGSSRRRGSTSSRTSRRSIPAISPLPNVFLLPHLGSATVETRNAMGFGAWTISMPSSREGRRPSGWSEARGVDGYCSAPPQAFSMPAL